MKNRFSSRREFLWRTGQGIAGLAFTDLLLREQAAAATREPHFPPKAKAVISIFCSGGVSQVDTFDYKPELYKRRGEAMTGKGQIVVSQGNPGGFFPSPWKFAPYGQSGKMISELFQHTAKHVDDLAFIHSLHTLSNDHTPAILQMNTGTVLPGSPSMGSWITYGLGSENKNLPAFVVFTDPRGAPTGGAPNWGNGYMPAAYQATPFRPVGDPIVDLRPPTEMTPQRQREWLDLLGGLNEEHRQKYPDDTELSARLATYELAYQMQTHAIEAVGVDKESEATKKLYGLDEPQAKSFGRQCLLARRLVERGVRFVQIYSGGSNNFSLSWDCHFEMKTNYENRSAETDKPLAGLLADLKGRGLLDSTLVIFHTEFGRMPISQQMYGRDHNQHAFSIWMAGGGVKGGSSVGVTDEFGYLVAERKLATNDLHATILHLLGLHHEKLTYFHNGRNMRLTDVSGEVIREILA